MASSDIRAWYYKKDFSRYFFVFKGLNSGIFPEYELDNIYGEKIVAKHSNLIEKIVEALDKKLLKQNSDYLHVWIDLWRYEGMKPENPDDHFKSIMERIEEFKKQSDNSGLT